MSPAKKTFSKISLLLLVFIFVFLVTVVSSSAYPIRPQLQLSNSSDSEEQSATFPYMKELTTLHVDGSVEEVVEFRIHNTDQLIMGQTTVWIATPTAEYSNVHTWDDAGEISHQITLEGNYIYITIFFRNPIPLGGYYHYFLAIDLGNVAVNYSDHWNYHWTTYFEVDEFVRGIQFPSGVSILNVSPTPTTETSTYFEWVVEDITSLTVDIDYQIRPLTDLELANKFSPLIRLHSLDMYVPMKADLALQHAREIRDDIFGLTQSGGLTFDDLESAQWMDNTNAYIDFQGDPMGEEEDGSSQNYYISNLKSRADADPTVYSYVDRSDPDHIVVQYWLFYYYNSWGLDNIGGLNKHEGDWEMVQVVLDRDEIPLYAAFSQHAPMSIVFYGEADGGSKKEWNDLARVDTHPIVYTGSGSHASYFGPYSYILGIDKTANDDSEIIVPTVVLLQPNMDDSWISFQGHWGEKVEKLGLEIPGHSGPKSPGSLERKWSNRLAWSEEDIPWDETATHHRGKVRVYEDEPYNSLIVDVTTNDWFGWYSNTFYSEINSGEYIVNETSKKRTMIIHESLGTDHLKYLVIWTRELSFTPSMTERLENQNTEIIEGTIEYVDSVSNNIITLTYEFPDNWQPDSKATVEIVEESSFEMNVYIDDDSIVDATYLPVRRSTTPVEPPTLPGNRIYLPFTSNE